MNHSIEHRGPDDFGYLYVNSSSGATSLTQSSACGFEPDVLLASRRLSITDIGVRARQPIANHDQTIFVVFNGALHNHNQLRAELVACGYQFKTSSDTEVLVHAYEHWGENCVNHFNGMWAFALWDQRKSILLLSRDRFGIKPLYFSESDGSFYFGSEIKTLIASKEIAISENRDYLRRQFLSAIPPEDSTTAFDGIHKLPAAHNLVVSKAGLRQYRYWQYTDSHCDFDFSQPENTFFELLKNAIDIRLQGDVETSLLLSGGMDSSALAVLAAQSNSKELPAFCARFKDYQHDESPYASLVSKRTGDPLTFVDYEPTHLIQDLEKVTWHLETPAILGQMIVRWHLLQAVSKDASIVLEGQGADEFIGGYPTYIAPYFRGEINNFTLSGLPALLLRFLDAALHDPSSAYLASAAKRKVKRAVGLNKPDMFKPASLLSEALPKSVNNGSPAMFEDPLNEVLWQDHSRLSLPYLLHFGDALSMAHSVESRLPFLDHRLVEFVFALPGKYKMQGSRSKVIMRNALGDILPSEILARRKKVGFNTPIEKWVQKNLTSEIKPRLLSSQSNQRGFFNPRNLENLIKKCEQNGEGAKWIYRCLATEVWYQTFVDVKT